MYSNTIHILQNNNFSNGRLQDYYWSNIELSIANIRLLDLNMIQQLKKHALVCNSRIISE